jgi:hypothetical protein
MFNFHVDELRKATPDRVSRDTRTEGKAAQIGIFNTWLEHSGRSSVAKTPYDMDKIMRIP